MRFVPPHALAAPRSPSRSSRHGRRPLMTRTQRWTLAVSARPRPCSCSTSRWSTPRCRRSPADLDTGSPACSGSSTPTRSRSRRRSSPPARWPTASAAASCSSSGSASSPPRRCCARRRSRSRCSTRRAPRRAWAPRSCSRSRWPCSSNAFPQHGRAHQGARRLRGDDGRLVRRRAARGRRAHLGARLALDLPDQPAARSALPLDRPPVRRRVDGSARAARGSCGPGHAHGQPVPARLRAAPRQRGRVGRARRSSPASAAPSSCCARSWSSRPASRSRCSRCACSATPRSPARRWGRSGSPRRCSRCGST